MTVLYFPLGPISGFGDYQDTKINHTIRELLQNSLDAASTDQEKVTVKFVIERIHTKEIPHITEYRETLQLITEQVEKRGSFNMTARQHAQKILNTLEEDSVGVLTVIDNGEGFNKERIEALLDAMSYKEDPEKSAGAFGQGHLTAFGLSRLCYVLYAGKYIKNGTSYMLYSGSTVLAGFNDGTSNRDKQARIIQSRPQEDEERNPKYEYPDKPRDMPKYLRKHLSRIENTGAIVSILAPIQEWQEGGDDNYSAAEYSIASNYFAAILNGTLEVHIELPGSKPRILNDDNLSYLEKILERSKNESRKKAEQTVSGNKAWSAFQTYSKGTLHRIPVGEGQSQRVDVYINQDVRETDNVIALCRNGMWITHELPSPFTSLHSPRDKRPCSILISIDKKDSGELYELIKRAENPLHDAIKRHNLEKSKQAEFKKLCQGLCDKILEEIPDYDMEAFEIDLFAEEMAEPEESSNTAQRLEPKPIVDVRRRGTGRGRKKSPSPKPVNFGQTFEGGYSARRDHTSKAKHRIEIELHSKIRDRDVLFYLALHTGNDEGRYDTDKLIGLEKVKLNGKPLSAQDGKKRYWILSGLNAEEPNTLTGEYDPQSKLDYAVMPFFEHREPKKVSK